MVVFIGESDGAQVRAAPAAMAEMCHLFVDELVRRRTALHGIQPVLAALAKVRESAHSLSSLHADLCRLCLASRCLTPALRHCLRTDFNDVSREAAASDSKHVLLYYYYGGMILASVKVYRVGHG